MMKKTIEMRTFIKITENHPLPGGGYWFTPMEWFEEFCKGGGEKEYVDAFMYATEQSIKGDRFWF